MIKAWRDIAIPHQDVLRGTFKQSEFAADLSRVHTGDASEEYQNPVMFFQRTFITEGMRLLLDSVIQRLSGNGGDPVIQLQTAFGGGKTHTMLAVYHLAKGETPLSELQGIPPIIDKAGVTSLPKAKAVVIDGNQLSPGSPRTRDGITVNTLWGELAWQLGGANGYEQVKQADVSGTSPGKEDLIKLLKQYAPCVILVDELVAYIRQFEPGKTYTGGSYDSNISFIQALTEALKAVPNALMLVSLPDSNREAGSQNGINVLKTLEHFFGRIQALWKPVAAEEAFEIVRRRLFTSITDQASMEETCRTFADYYIANKNDFPNETQEAHYYDRLKQAYPIHPEIFDRLYEDWSSLDNFQRTRGVLKLMAKVIHKLWIDDNKDPLIMPGNLPLYDADVRNETIYYLPQGWDPVLERDIDGSRSETAHIEKNEARFGQLQACKKLARTIFFGSAPHAVALHSARTSRGIEYNRILLGSVQPDQVIGVFKDAMNRLVDKLHYLSNADNKLFWFDTRPNLRREMEDRKRRFNDKDDVVPVIKDQLQRLLSNGCFDGIHIFTRSDDIPDDYSLRLVILPPDAYYLRSGGCFAIVGAPNSDGAKKILTTRGEQPRLKQNRLIFLAADGEVIGRLKDQVLTLLAWDSILKDIQTLKLNLDQYQSRQAKTGFEDAKKSLDRIVKETYKWILVPEQDKVPGDKFEPFSINPSVPSIVEEIERILKENEHLITQWAPIHLHNLLKRWFWKDDVKEVRAKDIWHSTCCYLYLPRLKNENTFSNAINAGAESRDFFGLAYGKDGDDYVGFSYGKPMTPVFDSSLLLVDPLWAAEYQSQKTVIVDPPVEPPTEPGTGGTGTGGITGGGTTPPGGGSSGTTPPTPKPVQYKKRFYGRVNLKPTRAKADFATIVEEIVLHLINSPTVTASIKIEIEADCLEGFDEATQRTIKENCNTLKFDLSEFE
jgi:predicted AAA+ superfamily ATPase